MGREGLIGIRIDGEDKLTYDHWDSLPEHLGADMVKFCVEKTEAIDWLNVRKFARWLQDVPKIETAKERHLRMLQYVSEMTDTDEEYYEKMRLLAEEMTNTLNKILKRGTYEKTNNYITDSLSCQYAYIVNLDTMTLELYKGHQTSPHKKGRYADNEGYVSLGCQATYYPCALVGEYSVFDIPDDWVQCFIEDRLDYVDPKVEQFFQSIEGNLAEEKFLEYKKNCYQNKLLKKAVNLGIVETQAVFEELISQQYTITAKNRTARI